MKKKLRKITDAEEARINAGIALDPDTFEASDEEFASARRGRPALPEAERKKPVTMFMDPAVIAFFKQGGRGWQTRAHDVLARHVKRERSKAG